MFFLSIDRFSINSQEPSVLPSSIRIISLVKLYAFITSSIEFINSKRDSFSFKSGIMIEIFTNVYDFFMTTATKSPKIAFLKRALA